MLLVELAYSSLYPSGNYFFLMRVFSTSVYQTLITVFSEFFISQKEFLNVFLAEKVLLTTNVVVLQRETFVV
ncbi:MAG: hypothetical protein ACJA0U_001868 [Salibacteraceae bacterium]|jgi:hypothetical protein